MKTNEMPTRRKCWNPRCSHRSTSVVHLIRFFVKWRLLVPRGPVLTPFTHFDNDDLNSVYFDGTSSLLGEHFAWQKCKKCSWQIRFNFSAAAFGRLSRVSVSSFARGGRTRFQSRSQAVRVGQQHMAWTSFSIWGSLPNCHKGEESLWLLPH